VHRFIAQRLTSMAATIVAVSLVIFLGVRLLPGNIVDIMFGRDRPPLSDEVRCSNRRARPGNGRND